MSKSDWSVLVYHLDSPPMTQAQRAAIIAAELRKGILSKTFCQILAGMIDGEKNVTPFRLSLRRKGRGQPPGADLELGKEMISATAGVARGRLKAVKQKVAKRFHVSLRTAENAMSDEIRFQKLARLVDEAKTACRS